MQLSELSIAQIRSLVFQGDGPLPNGIRRQLRQDRRRGVRLIYENLQKKEGQLRKERRRVWAMQRFERQLREGGAVHIAGVDEVGMGPLAGPVVAAAIVFPPNIFLPGVDDSKRLTPGQRRKAARSIQQAALGVGIGAAEVEEIDRLNIYHAGLLAMRRAVCSLPVQADWLLVDGRELPGAPQPQHRANGGDRLHFVIAAASIVAKTHRDGLMCQLDSSYPQYGFARNKGYGTREHCRSIERHGPCPVHRRSFGFIRELRGEYSALFYRLRNRLTCSKTAAQLSRLEAEFSERRAQLSGAELKKLRRLLARQRRSFNHGV